MSMEEREQDRAGGSGRKKRGTHAMKRTFRDKDSKRDY